MAGEEQNPFERIMKRRARMALLLLGCGIGLGILAYKEGKRPAMRPAKVSQKDRFAQRADANKKFPRSKSAKTALKNSARAVQDLGPEDVKRLAALLKADDICTIAREFPILKADPTTWNRGFYIDALLSIQESELEFSPEDVAALRVLRDGLTSPEIYSTSPQMAFLTAAHAIPDTYGAFSTEQVNVAREIILRSAEENPNNGAFQLYKGMILAETAPDAVVREQFLTAFAADGFRTFDSTFRFNILRGARRNASTFMITQLLLDSVPIPSPNEITKLLMEISREDPEFADAALAWAKQRRVGVIENPSGVFFYEEDFFEFSLGTRVFVELQRSNRIPASQQIPPEELFPRETVANPLEAQSLRARQGIFRPKDGNCDRSELDDFFRLFRESLD